MLKVTILPALFLVSAISINAQNYRAVHPERIALYEEINSRQIRSMRIDSVNDSILYPITNIRDTGNYCYTPRGPSWMGKQIIENRGRTLFFNYMDDTLVLINGAKLNESWIFGKTDLLVFRATVARMDTMSFLGLADSVKTITIRVYDKLHNPAEHALDSSILLLSKNYGLVRTLNFYFFPDFEDNMLYERISELNLVGLTNPETGVQNIKWFDVYDFQPGDELHILKESDFWGSFNLREKIKIKKKYLGREDYADSVSYELEYLYSKERTVDGVYSFEFLHDTISESYIADTIFDHLPGEPVWKNQEGWTYSMTSDTKTGPSFYSTFNTGEDCWMPIIADGCFPDYVYYRGLGGPYTSCTGAFTPGTEEKKLVYYKKGQQTWGTPLVITGISESEGHKEILVYPNPCKGQFSVTGIDQKGGSYQISILNMQGQLIFTDPDYMDGKIIYISNYTGTFILRISTADHIFFRKLILE